MAATTQVDPITQPRLGLRGWLRWTWRQLTSMRTALFLLLLLAVGAVPGSIWPQRGIDASRTSQYLADHTTVGPWLDRFGFFDVYSSPWFSAIYLLLFISLVGCVVPRSRIHLRAIRERPPKAPRRLERLSEHRELEVSGTVEDVVAASREVLRQKRFRVFSHDADGVSAESGHLKETGNLVFHLALILVIVGVAVGHLFGFKGDVILPVGQTFANTLSRYDTFAPGPWVDAERLSPFSLTLDRFDAVFETDVRSAGQFGSPRDFTAYVTTTTEPGSTPRRQVIKVNHPLEMEGATVFLLGNGYAPVVTVRDGSGTVVYSGPTPFLPQDNNYRSIGAVKVPGAQPKQLGFVGLFLPTYVLNRTAGPSSVFPDALDPALALGPYEGNLFPGGVPQSVFTLDQRQMTSVPTSSGDVGRILLRPGQTATLPGGRGSITFDRVERFAGLSIRSDPGKGLTLVAALLALTGLIGTLTLRRRRVFVRVTPGDREGVVRVSLGALAKEDDEGLAGRVEDIVTALRLRTGTTR